MPRKRIGRRPDKTPCPPISRRLAHAIQDYLMEHFEMKRPPEVAASVLALVVECYERGQPFPVREKIANRLGLTGPYGIDAALNTALARKLLTEEWFSEPGTVHNRTSAVRRRRYIPSQDLLNIAKELGRQAA